MTLDDDIEHMTRIPLFATFEASALRMLAFSAETRLLRAGDVLFERGEISDGGYILTMGSIVLDGYGARGKAKILLRPWTLIGETALITATTRPSTASAGEPSTVLKISRPLFHQILEQHPLSAVRARDFLKNRLQEFTREATALQNVA